MRPIPSSKKGVETAPMYVAFSAFVMVLMAGIAYPALMTFQDNMKIGKALKEMKRLGSTIDEACTLGDLGSVQTITLDVPEPLFIRVNKDQLTLLKYDGNGGVVKPFGPDSDDLVLKLKGEINEWKINWGGKSGWIKQDWISGKREFVVACWDDSFSNVGVKEGQIFVKHK